MNLWPIIRYGIDEGLPSNQVHELAEDARGRLWLAGPAGLTCFDGTVATNLDRRHGLACSGLRSVAVDRFDTVWIGTDRGLEAISSNLEIRGVHDPSALPQGLVDCLTTTRERIWAAFQDSLVCIHLDDQGHGVVEPIGAIGAVVSLCSSKDGDAAWAVGASGELFTLTGGQVLPLSVQMLAGAPPSITCVAHAPDGLLLAGTSSGLLVLDGWGVTVQSIRLSEAVVAVEATESEWWVACGNVAYVFAANRQTECIAELTTASRINSIHADRWGNVWLATDNSGLQKVSCLRQTISRVPVGGQRAVYSIHPVGESGLRVGGEGFCSLIDVAGKGAAQTIAEVPSMTVWDSHEDGQERVWLATQNGVFRGDVGREPAQFGATETVLACPARVLIEHAGWLWIGTLRGLARVRDDRVDEVRTGDGRPFGYVYALNVDRDGRLWIATLGNGLWRIDDVAEGPMRIASLPQLSNVYAVTHGMDSRILVLYDDWVVILDAQGNAHPVVQRFPVSGWAALWIRANLVLLGTSQGLQFLYLGDVITLREVRLIFPDGDWEFTNNRTLLRGSDGRIYCGVNGGLLAVCLESLNRFSAPPTIKVAKVEWRGIKPEVHDGVFRLRPGKWSMSQHVFCAWLVDESHVRYRFRLVGFDDDWSALQALPEASYSSLPPGQYELEGQAYSPLTSYGPVVSISRLAIKESAWEHAAIANIARVWQTIVATLAWPIVNLVSRRRHRQIEAEIQERTESLRMANQELRLVREELAGALRTDTLTGIANRHQFDERLGTEFLRASRNNTRTAVILVDIDWFKLVNDRYGHHQGDAVLREVATVIASTVRETDLAARWGGEEFVVILPDTDTEPAVHLAERIRRAILDCRIDNVGSPIGQVSVSCGVASASYDDRALLLQRADLALYEAKRGGRNQVEAR